VEVGLLVGVMSLGVEADVVRGVIKRPEPDDGIDVEGPLCCLGEQERRCLDQECAQVRAPLIWVPTQKATRSGLAAWRRGRTMSTVRSIALASTLFGLMISTASVRSFIASSCGGQVAGTGS
jgi:hypothetical protein